MTVALQTQLNNEIAARKAADAGLLARIVALENAAKPPPATGVVRPFPLSGTPAEFMAALVDPSIDILELAGGTRHWPLQIINVERPTRPLTVRPAAGAVCTFVGDLGGPAFHFGRGGKASDIAFEFAGVIFDGYSIGDTGIVWMGSVQRMRFNGPTVQNVTCIGTGPTNTWALYLSIDGGLSPQDVIADNWTVKGTARGHSALQVGHPPSVMANIKVRGWSVSSVDIALYAYSVVNGLTVDGWTITDSQRDDRLGTVFFGPQVIGTFSNMHSDLGNLEAIGGMTRGAGNVGV